MRVTHSAGQVSHVLDVFATRENHPILPLVKETQLQQVRVKLGAAIRRRRNEKEQTQSELADVAGLSQADVSRLERGEQGFDSTTIFKVSVALECSLTELFSEAEQAGTAALSPEAVKIARLAMALPADMREDYRRRMQGLLDALRVPVPDELAGRRRPRKK